MIQVGGAYHDLRTESVLQKLTCISNIFRSSECEIGCILAWINRKRNEGAMSPSLKMKVNRCCSNGHAHACPTDSVLTSQMFKTMTSIISPKKGPAMGQVKHCIPFSLFLFVSPWWIQRPVSWAVIVQHPAPGKLDNTLLHFFRPVWRVFTSFGFTSFAQIEAL